MSTLDALERAEIESTVSVLAAVTERVERASDRSALLTARRRLQGAVDEPLEESAEFTDDDLGIACEVLETLVPKGDATRTRRKQTEGDDAVFSFARMLVVRELGLPRDVQVEYLRLASADRDPEDLPNLGVALAGSDIEFETVVRTVQPDDEFALEGYDWSHKIPGHRSVTYLVTEGGSP